MRRTNIYLDERQTADLDRLAAQEGVSRAEIIRRLIDSALRGRDADVDTDLAAIATSFGAAAHVEPADRGPGAREEHLARVWRSSP